MSKSVHHPSHYGGGDNPLEAIKVIEAWGLSGSFHMGNAVKYILRHKAKGKPLEDLQKALWYIDRACHGRPHDVHPCEASHAISLHAVAAEHRLCPRLTRALEEIKGAASNRYTRLTRLLDAAALLREVIADLQIGVDVAAA